MILHLLLLVLLILKYELGLCEMDISFLNVSQAATIKKSKGPEHFF
jgi:hypothetical protein